MSEDERLDMIEGTDEDGNKVLLQVIRYFFYNGEEYVLLGEQEDESETEKTLYVMKVLDSTDDDGEEIEEFVPVDEDIMDDLVEVASQCYSENSIDDEDENEGE